MLLKYLYFRAIVQISWTKHYGSENFKSFRVSPPKLSLKIKSCPHLTPYQVFLAIEALSVTLFSWQNTVQGETIVA